MNVEATSMDTHEARKLYLEYRNRVRDHRAKRRARLDKKLQLLEREDEELRATYRALSLGQRVLNVAQVLRAAGVNEKHQPKLAIAPAGTEFCFFTHRWQRVGSWQFCFYQNRDYPERAAYRVDADAFPEQTSRLGTLRAAVPAIPAQFRPAGELDGYFILWEAEWAPIAPADPLLLKRISGDIFAVLAQWDLTPVEKMVLEGRFAAR